MSFVLFGNFNGYGGWQAKIIDVCQNFFEKYDRYPNFIRMKEKTMDALFDEADKEFEDPYSEEHAVRDSEGNILIPLHIDSETRNLGRPENLPESDIEYFDDYIEEYNNSDYETRENDDIIDDDDNETIYPKFFGPNDDGTVSFITNKFELKFLEGEDLPDDYFIVQFGDGPEDGGEDFEENESEPEQKKITLAA